MRPDAAFNRRVMRVFEDMLDQRPMTRDTWLESVCGDEPEVRDAVRAMMMANRSASALPTAPPEPGPHADVDAVPVSIGQYRIIREIGRGGMGVVYLGERDDGLFEHRVAIKLMRHTLLSQRALERFATERRILARLRHPHIAQMLDGGVTQQEDSYIVMELIDGVPITEYCSCHSLDLTARLEMFREAADAVDHAHRNLIVHADIKPSNVIVEDGFGVKLLDFGISRLLDDSKDEPIFGHTPGYASQARIDGLPAIPADDIYAAGRLLAALVEGRPGVDRDFEAVIGKATATDAEQRYGSIREFLDDLARWQTGVPVRAAVPSRRRLVQLFWRRNRLWLRLAILAVLATVIGLGVITTLWVDSERQRMLAEERYVATQRMANYIIGDVDPALARVGGTLMVRKQLLERTGAYLRALEASRSASPALKREIAAGYLRMAKVYGLDPGGGIGNLGMAKAELAHASRLIDEAAVAEPDASQLLALRGQARMLAGAEVYVAPTRLVARASLTNLQQAQMLLERYLTLRPDDISMQLALWQVHFMRERDYFFLGQPLIGLASLQRELVKAKLQVQNATQRDERDYILNASYLELAENYEASDPDRSLQYYTMLINRVEQMRFAGGLDWESDLTEASAHIGRGREEAKLAQLSRSENDYLQAVAMLRRLLRTDDNHIMRWEVAYVQSLLAEVQSKLGRQSLARQSSDDSIDWLQQDLTEAPHDTSRLRTFAFGLSTRAAIERRAGAVAQACSVARRAVHSWTELSQAHATTERDRAPNGPEEEATSISIGACRARR